MAIFAWGPSTTLATTKTPFSSWFVGCRRCCGCSCCDCGGGRCWSHPSRTMTPPPMGNDLSQAPDSRLYPVPEQSSEGSTTMAGSVLPAESKDDRSSGTSTTNMNSSKGGGSRGQGSSSNGRPSNATSSLSHQSSSNSSYLQYSTASDPSFEKKKALQRRRRKASQDRTAGDPFGLHGIAVESFNAGALPAMLGSMVMDNHGHHSQSEQQKQRRRIKSQHDGRRQQPSNLLEREGATIPHSVGNIDTSVHPRSLPASYYTGHAQAAAMRRTAQTKVNYHEMSRMVENDSESLPRPKAETAQKVQEYIRKTSHTSSPVSMYRKKNPKNIVNNNNNNTAARPCVGVPTNHVVQTTNIASLHPHPHPTIAEQSAALPGITLDDTGIVPDESTGATPPPMAASAGETEYLSRLYNNRTWNMYRLIKTSRSATARASRHDAGLPISENDHIYGNDQGRQLASNSLNGTTNQSQSDETEMMFDMDD